MGHTQYQDKRAEEAKVEHLLDVGDERVIRVVYRINFNTKGGAGDNIHRVGTEGAVKETRHLDQCGYLSNMVFTAQIITIKFDL